MKELRERGRGRERYDYMNEQQEAFIYVRRSLCHVTRNILEENYKLYFSSSIICILYTSILRTCNSNRLHLIDAEH